LRENGFDESEVVVVHPDDLEKMVGPETEIVAIGGHDLLGINPPTSEFVELASTGPPYNRVKFLELLDNPVLENVDVVVGGKSAWQVADERVMGRLGIDYVHIGEGERSANLLNAPNNAPKVTSTKNTLPAPTQRAARRSKSRIGFHGIPEKTTAIATLNPQHAKNEFTPVTP
ncbi:hypothetical protein AKJ48_01055, partial [candidate division MSBL1 archaeon SCGC-AAA261O19]